MIVCFCLTSFLFSDTILIVMLVYYADKGKASLKLVFIFVCIGFRVLIKEDW